MAIFCGALATMACVIGLCLLFHGGTRTVPGRWCFGLGVWTWIVLSSGVIWGEER